MLRSANVNNKRIRARLSLILALVSICETVQKISRKKLEFSRKKGKALVPKILAYQLAVSF